MNQIVSSFLLAGTAVSTYMIILFIISVRIRDNSIADIAWGPGFIIAAVSAMIYHEAFGWRNLLITSLIMIWGLRLGLRIFLRHRGRGEDARYKKWRNEWGRTFFIRSFFQVFILQGLLLLVNVSPVLIVNSSSGNVLTYIDGAGLVLWITGFIFETTGDWQLDRFVQDPSNRGKIMDQGLWRYTRHPNYFGEVTMWWGIYLIALSAPLGYLGAAGPIVITTLILFVSGVPMTERFMAGKTAFEEYKKRTSVFIPWFPGKN
jgi:steroid 5-alpha reductase family enzyme